ncbi:uncharacterized protein LOC111641822 [Centruroides sculpturatus]|uniref:uncharacterized protein LOC111641822 n=1 Tax=Centruroides sculpturatus TaxID=218467 RepID=UPI000C6CDEEE|nr:uncharacterized protein LOC111641822 [Centruroides sculpturatus]
MDNFSAGDDTDPAVIQIYRDITDMMGQIQLPMAKWATNSELLKKLWEDTNIAYTQKTRILGVDWDTAKDEFSIDYNGVVSDAVEHPGTKRLLLAATSRFYDPLGLFAPVSITGKIIFQDTWLRGLQWDEVLPADISTHWKHWLEDLQHLSFVSIPRWIKTTRLNLHRANIHVFCDASERAYGAVIYIRTNLPSGISTCLLCSKARLAPIKRVTLPRLELLAALVGCRLLKYITTETNLQRESAVLWSDAKVILGWIRGHPNRWKTFVQNRVSEIQSITNPNQWRHCPGTDNPADHLSRGLTAEHLRSCTSWWRGPQWLSQTEEYWPANDHPTPSDCATEERKHVVTLHTAAYIELLDISRFSSYIRLLRVTAWILRFITLCKIHPRNNHPKGELSADEVSSARDHWIRSVQKTYFANELIALNSGALISEKSPNYRFHPFLSNGILKVGGRLQFADVRASTQHPILLDGRHTFTRLLIMDCHLRLGHLGTRVVLANLREEFWILRARQVIKTVLHRCLPCQRQRSQPYQETEAPLPPDRVLPSPPFSITGVDFAGPLYIRKGQSIEKSYITLFTCATTRAVHLELSSSMSTDSFLLCLQCFVGRRGLPRKIYSDNAKSFHAANKELRDLWQSLSDKQIAHYSAHHGITWIFNVEKAAWWGGWWERMVGSVKRCLRKILGKSLVNAEQMSTVLTGVEAALNNRPLVHNYDTEEPEALTPSHFLIGKRISDLPEPNNHTPIHDLVRQWRHLQSIIDSFWRRWQKEYLLDLQSFHQVRRVKKKLPPPREGALVLLREDSLPRQMWRTAVIEELITGRDGCVRTCRLRLPDQKRISRPIQLVLPLEAEDQGGEDVRDATTSGPTNSERGNLEKHVVDTTRSGCVPGVRDLSEGVGVRDGSEGGEGEKGGKGQS